MCSLNHLISGHSLSDSLLCIKNLLEKSHPEKEGERNKELRKKHFKRYVPNTVFDIITTALSAT